jgi:hypothetical protein
MNCQGTNKNGAGCARRVSGYCWQHKDQKPVETSVETPTKLIRDDRIVSERIRDCVLGMDLKNPKNIKWIKRLRRSRSYKYAIDGKLVGFAVVSTGADTYDFIEFVMSFRPGKGITKMIIDAYRQMFCKELIPYEFADGSIGFWYKYYCNQGYDTVKSIFQYLRRYGLIEPGAVQWEPLLMRYFMADSMMSSMLQLVRRNSTLKEMIISAAQ